MRHSIKSLTRLSQSQSVLKLSAAWLIQHFSSIICTRYNIDGADIMICQCMYTHAAVSATPSLINKEYILKQNMIRIICMLCVYMCAACDTREVDSRRTQIQYSTHIYIIEYFSPRMYFPPYRDRHITLYHM